MIICHHSDCSVHRSIINVDYQLWTLLLMMPYHHCKIIVIALLMNIVFICDYPRLETLRSIIKSYRTGLDKIA